MSPRESLNLGVVLDTPNTSINLPKLILYLYPKPAGFGKERKLNFRCEEILSCKVNVALCFQPDHGTGKGLKQFHLKNISC